MGSGMHAPDTRDCTVVLKGQIGFYAESDRVELSAGDLLVDRGVSHRWRTIGDEPAITAVSMLPAHPIAGGAKA